MNKSILISIRPEHVVKILNGEKTLELRKSVPQDFVGWVYIYVTKARKKLILHTFDNVWRIGNCMGSNENKPVNGKVVARFWFDEWETISFFSEYKADGEWGYCYMQHGEERNISRADFLKRVCLTEEGILKYTKDSRRPFYSWHIKRLEIFNKPKDLWDFHTRHDMLFLGRAMARKVFQFESVYKAPQSWQYAYLKEGKI